MSIPPAPPLRDQADARRPRRPVSPRLVGLIAAAVVVVVAISNGDSDDAKPKKDPAVVQQENDAHDCDVMRRALTADKARANEASAKGNSNEDAFYRGEVEKDARAARSIPGCDISDLVGANVGQ